MANRRGTSRISQSATSKTARSADRTAEKVRGDSCESAAKGLMQRIRELSGIQLDSAALVDYVFSIDRPLVALNSLTTETERSEHKGFATLLKGCFAAVRSPLAHEPKLLWKGADDAADYLSLISLLHRKA